MVDSHDADVRYCPSLGHEIAFSYCRKPGSEIPCRRIFDCWWERFDITTFMKQNYSEEVLEKITRPQQPKSVSLAQIIKEAQERIESRDSRDKRTKDDE
ncbi:MAG: hypothetical protein ACOC4C_04835 [Fibrobacterota bacterium]